MRSAAVFSSRNRMPSRTRPGFAGSAGTRRPTVRRTPPRKGTSVERSRSRPGRRSIDQRKIRNARPRARPQLILPGEFVPLVVH
jgi:hypothetical protein